MSLAPGMGAIDSWAGPDFEGEALVQIRVPARADRLRLVRGVVQEVAVAAGCTEDCARDIVIAVDEACQNVIRHAYGGKPGGEVILDIRRVDDRLCFNLLDFAEPVDVAGIKPRDLGDLRPGGLGTHFIHECMDEVAFLAPPVGTGNRLRMLKQIS